MGAHKVPPGVPLFPQGIKKQSNEPQARTRGGGVLEMCKGQEGTDWRLSGVRGEWVGKMRKTVAAPSAGH